MRLEKFNIIHNAPDHYSSAALVLASYQLKGLGTKLYYTLV